MMHSWILPSDKYEKNITGNEQAEVLRPQKKEKVYS